MIRELALFAGAGGGLLASVLLGFTTVCAVEIDEYCRRVILQRQSEGCLPLFPIWDDVRTFKGEEWRGTIDVVSGGFPCQDISSAGSGAGINGERSGLWKEYARIVSEVRPKAVFIENSPLLASRGLDVVIRDLASMGFNARWGVFSACSIGFPQMRKRMFILAYAKGFMVERWIRARKATSRQIPSKRDREMPRSVRMESNSELRRMADGLAHRVDRLKAIGNGQVPEVAAFAFETLARMN